MWQRPVPSTSCGCQPHRHTAASAFPRPQHLQPQQSLSLIHQEHKTPFPKPGHRQLPVPLVCALQHGMPASALRHYSRTCGRTRSTACAAADGSGSATEQHHCDAPETGKRAVVITGASSGIGAATALLLAQQGWRVFAGVRRRADADAAAAAHGNITPVILDITDEVSIADAVDQVAAAVGSDGVAALVNNAGRAVTAPVEFLPLDVFRQQIEVNLTGMIAVTQRFLPLLRTGRPGRIVNIGSQSGTVALPLFAPYACSKFGVEALSDCLRVELAGQGIEVCLVSPGAVRTPIWSKSGDAATALLAGAPAEAEAMYGRLIRQVQAGAAHAESRGVSAETVAAVVSDTLNAATPRTRQVVGTAAAVQMAVRRLVPDRLWDRLLMSSLEKRGRVAEAAPADPPLG